MTRSTSLYDASDDAPDGIFNIRDVILFEDGAIVPSMKEHVIRVRPEFEHGGEALVHRIVMHRTIAGKLLLLKAATGNILRTKGRGSCEIFLAEVPNWTPQKWRISYDKPLELTVFNPTPSPIGIVGQVIVWRQKYRGE